MALQARITNITQEDNGVAYSVQVEFYDDADPTTVLFTQPGESWSFDGIQGIDYAKKVILDYGHARLATLEAVASLQPGTTLTI